MAIYCVADACDGETRVVQTNGMYRRRKCLTCHKTFITEENQCLDPPKGLWFVPAEERKNGRTLKPRVRYDSCIRGHKFTPENTSWSTGPSGKPQRGCKTCRKLRLRAKYRNDPVWREKERTRKREEKRRKRNEMADRTHGLPETANG